MPSTDRAVPVQWPGELASPARISQRARASGHDLRITPCWNWNAVKKILGKGRKVALPASKTEFHVWPTGTPNPSDRCLCGARRR